MRVWTRAVLCGSALLGCKGKMPTSELPVPEVDVASPVWAGSLPKLADTLPAQQVWGCETDADCALTWHVDGSCCDRLCWDVAPYNEGFVVLLAEQRAGDACTEARCPVASCLAPTVEHRARCRDTRCIDDPVAIPAPEEGRR